MADRLITLDVYTDAAKGKSLHGSFRVVYNADTNSLVLVEFIEGSEFTENETTIETGNSLTALGKVKVSKKSDE
jgi:hypothetical protein